MKNENIQKKRISLLDNASLMLTTSPKEYTVTFKVTSYISPISIATDLIKLCTVTIDTEKPHISPLVKNNSINSVNILKLAL